MILITVIPADRGPGTSPTEPIGRILADKLLKAGQKVRVLAESAQAKDWPKEVEVIEGSILQPAESPHAFKGIERVFLAGATAKTVKDFVAAVKKEGIKRVVVLSSHGCEFEVNYPPETWFWLAIEKAVEESGSEWTHVRLSAVMASMFASTYPATGSGWPESIRKDGVVKEPLLNAGYYPFIHEDDVAAVVEATLLKDGYTSKVIEAVNMPISTVDRVKAISKVIGKEIHTEELTIDEGRALWQKQGWPDETIDVTLYALEEYGKNLEYLTQWTADQKPSVKEIIGRPLRTFEEWAAEHATDFK